MHKIPRLAPFQKKLCFKNMCCSVLFSLISSLKQAFTTILSSSHSYNNCFCLSESGSCCAMSIGISLGWTIISVVLNPPPIFWTPSDIPGHNVGQAGMKKLSLLTPVSITQSSYSIKCSNQGVVSYIGGIEIG